MDDVLYLIETSQVSKIIQSIRSEITSAVRTALVRHAYDTDIQLSFGTIHINSKGSVSQISFKGTDVADMDAFVVQQALSIGDNNYYDLRKKIKDDPDDFSLYPIQIGGKISLTVLKTSTYFERKYGATIHSTGFRVEYASKYIIIYPSAKAAPDVYCVGLFDPISTANTLLEKAGKSIGCKNSIYYCFMNSRPELFLHLGQVKSDFEAYHPDKNPNQYNFYKGSVLSGVFKINKKTDKNGKIQVKETNKKCLKLIIKIQYGSVDHFCALFEIDKTLLTAYLSGSNAEIKYVNGNAITPTRLGEILNLPFTPDAEGLKERNLLVKVEYDEIPG